MNILSQYPWLTYALRSILASATLYSYYRIFLFNRPFHQVNRFFLLGSALMALLLPLIPLSLHLPWESSAPGQTISLVFSPATHTPPADTTQSIPYGQTLHTRRLIFLLLYSLVAALLLGRLIFSVYRIIRTAHKYPSTRIGTIRLLHTNEPGSPFSFLNWLFWNAAMDLDDDKYRLVFLHESYHIRHKHSLDILALECLRSLCWFNPFFHVICREIRTVHEFQADRNALRQSDPHDYAELLVWRAATQPVPFLQHPFFHSSIKRRITMITQQRTRRPNPLGRIMALPVLALLLAGATAAPAQDHQQAPVFKSASSPDSTQLERLYCRYLRYPKEAIAAQQEGHILFSVRIDKAQGIVDFTPLDALPLGPKPLKIVVVALPDGTPSPSLTMNEARQLLLNEARRVSGQINQALAAKGHPLASGEYFLEIQFNIEQPSKDKTKHA